MLEFSDPFLAVQEYLALINKLEKLDPDTIVGHPRTVEALSDSYIYRNGVVPIVDGPGEKLRATRMVNHQTNRLVEIVSDDILAPGTLHFMASGERVAKLTKVGSW